jgi:hypothetical protein
MQVTCVDDNENRMLAAMNDILLGMRTQLQIVSCCALVRTGHFYLHRHLVFISQESLTLLNTAYTIGFILDWQLHSEKTSRNSTLCRVWRSAVANYGTGYLSGTLF